VSWGSRFSQRLEREGGFSDLSGSRKDLQESAGLPQPVSNRLFQWATVRRKLHRYILLSIASKITQEDTELDQKGAVLVLIRHLWSDSIEIRVVSNES